MAEWRATHSDCPLGGEAHMDRCQPCLFFRGASLSDSRAGWRISCNWPRSGSYIAPDPTPLPEYVRAAFTEETE